MKIVEYQKLSNSKLEMIYPIHEACLKQEATHYIAEAENEEERQRFKGKYKRFLIKNNQ